MGLEAGGRGGAEEKEKAKEEEKIPHMCESTGDRPLWGRCPASPSTSNTTYSGRARVPLTLWVTLGHYRSFWVILSCLWSFWVEPPINQLNFVVPNFTLFLF